MKCAASSVASCSEQSGAGATCYIQQVPGNMTWQYYKEIHKSQFRIVYLTGLCCPGSSVSLHYLINKKIKILLGMARPLVEKAGPLVRLQWRESGTRAP